LQASERAHGLDDLRGRLVRIDLAAAGGEQGDRGRGRAELERDLDVLLQRREDRRDRLALALPEDVHDVVASTFARRYPR
jgi:hypothetical protein